MEELLNRMKGLTCLDLTDLFCPLSTYHVTASIKTFCAGASEVKKIVALQLSKVL